MATQSEIIDQLKNGNYACQNMSHCKQIEIEFNSLNNSINYAWKFKKTAEFWSDKEWKSVARDVQKELKSYFSRS